MGDLAGEVLDRDDDDPSLAVEHADAVEAVRARLPHLTPLRAKAVEDWLAGLNTVQAGELRGVTSSNVRQLRLDAVADLRYLLGA
jgi:hypothetical protein